GDLRGSGPNPERTVHVLPGRTRPDQHGPAVTAVPHRRPAGRRRPEPLAAGARATSRRLDHVPDVGAPPPRCRRAGPARHPDDLLPAHLADGPPDRPRTPDRVV